MGKALPRMKARYMAVLEELREELLRKHPDKAERIESIADTIMKKLDALSTSTSTILDYIRTVHKFSKEFPELLKLIPSMAEITEVLWGK